MRAFLPPLVLLGGAWLAQHFLGLEMIRRRNRVNAALPDATDDEQVRAVVAEGNTARLMLGGFAMFAMIAAGAIWLAILLVRAAF